MKKRTQPQTIWFVGFSLVVFAFIFLLSSIALNSRASDLKDSKNTHSAAPVRTISSQNYIIEETADPFITKVIKK